MTNFTISKQCQPQPIEPPEWYNRFHIYLTLGPSRTITAALRNWTGSKSKPSITRCRQADAWNWKERAMAFDQANRKEEAALASSTTAESRKRRLRPHTRRKHLLERPMPDTPHPAAHQHTVPPCTTN